ncbi:MAG TPA: glycosyltransferase [Patescibacteria group bacterium]|nr:glycosyltransferase [Patescibacteria group bacterium]
MLIYNNSPGHPMKILIYPRAQNNPYHDLLYGELQSAHPYDTLTYVPVSATTLIFFPIVMFAKRLQGYSTFHLHWHAFYLNPSYRIPGSKVISLLNTLWSLAILKLLGYKIIWTVHNVLPHEPQTSNDRLVTRFTAHAASRLIVHSTQAIEELREANIDASKATIIPHGNYDGAHPTTLTRAQARKRLHAQPNETLILFFGNIRPYKGIEDKLLPAFAQLDTTNVRLIVAGRCHDPALKRAIGRFAQKYPNVNFIEGSVADEDVSMYFDAADIVCLPFKAMTTSGSVILAATYGKPIVTPYIGSSKDLPKDLGVLYNPDEKNALLHALQTVLSEKQRLPKMATAARAYADTLAWSKLAAKTYAVWSSYCRPPKLRAYIHDDEAQHEENFE